MLGYTVLRRPRAEQERRPPRRGLGDRYRLTAATVAVPVLELAAAALADLAGTLETSSARAKDRY